MATATSSDGGSTGVLPRGLELLRSLLPAGWELTDEPYGTSPDATVITLKLSNSYLRMLVDARREFTPRDVASVLGGRMAQIRTMAGQIAILIVAPWLSPQARERLAAENINYLDLAGNLRIVTENPFVYIEREVPRERGPRRGRVEPRLAGVKAGRIVRLLVDVAPPYGVIQLAGAAGVTPGYMSRLLDSLQRDGLVERAKRGTVVEVDWAGLLRRRAEYYSVFETNPVQWFLCPNGAGYARETLGDLARIGDLPRDATLTGSFAAILIAPVAAPALLALYATDGGEKLVTQGRMVPADEGANVAILRPHDQGVLERPAPLAAQTSLIPVVGLSQLVLDCLTGTGRMPAEGEALLTWMSENQTNWRLENLSELAGQSHA